MGSTTQYLRYTPHSVFGLIGTGNSITFITHQSQPRKYVAVTACELIIIWDMRKQVKAVVLQCLDVRGLCRVVSARPATAGSATCNSTHLAAGYSAGQVVVFSLSEDEAAEPIVFSGHRGAVTALCWDAAGMRLASAGVDGELVVWDVVCERGVVRLRGHSGPINTVSFLENDEAPDVLVSAGKDGFIKFWAVAAGYCFRTLTPLTPEVWDFCLLRGGTRLVVGGSDAQLQVWSLHFHASTDSDTDAAAAMADTLGALPASKQPCLDETAAPSPPPPVLPGTDKPEVHKDDASILQLKSLGHLQRSAGGRVVGLSTSGAMLVCHGKHGALDVFQVLPDDQVAEKMKRRLRKARKRLREAGGGDGAAEGEEESAESSEPQLGDEMRCVGSIPTVGKVAAAAAAEDGSGGVVVAALLNDNSVVTLNWEATALRRENEEDNVTASVRGAGHRGEVRAASFTAVGDQLVTLSNDTLKTWHRGESGCQVTSTVALEELVRCLVVAPGDRHVVLGTDGGTLQLLELATGRLLETVAGHFPTENDKAGQCAVTALELTADNKGLISGGADKLVRCWKFELVSDECEGRRLSLQATDDVVTMNDAVTCIRCSHDGRLLAVATLDNKETLYYADTMKLHQELYGKSLPCTCLSFSRDGELLVTGCQDTSLRIYGTHFGDCRKLLKNAHTGGVTCVQFEGNTHRFFSAGHDGIVNYWDAGNFQRIISLHGHTGIIRCLALDVKAAWVVTGGQDRSLRLWHRTQEVVVLEEEREEERRRKEEEEEEEDMMAGQRRFVQGEEHGAEAVRASKPTFRTEQAVDMILTGLRMYQQQLEPGATPHYLMLTYNMRDPLATFIEILHRIKPSEVEEAIVQLELSQILGLLVLLCRAAQREQLTEVCVRVALVAVRTNLTQLLACVTAAPLLRTLHSRLSHQTRVMQDVVGFNRAGLKQLVERHERREETKLFAEAIDAAAQRKINRKKKQTAAQRAILAIK